MPLSLPSLDFAIICEGNELKTYGVKQEGSNSTTAFVASEAGKVSCSQHVLGEHEKTDCRDQQFSITYKNDLSDLDLSADLYIDGVCIHNGFLKAGRQCEVLGIPKTASSVLAFKFQELELVGAFPQTFLGRHVACFSHLPMKIQTWKMPLSCQNFQKWGQSNFERFAAGSCALHSTIIWITGCIKDVYRSTARRQGGIMSGTYEVSQGYPSQFSSTCDTR
jgi:hypothetical protein